MNLIMVNANKLGERNGCHSLRKVILKLQKNTCCSSFENKHALEALVRKTHLWYHP